MRARGVHVTALCPGFTYSEFHDVNGMREKMSKMPKWMWLSRPRRSRASWRRRASKRGKTPRGHRHGPTRLDRASSVEASARRRLARALTGSASRGSPQGGLTRAWQCSAHSTTPDDGHVRSDQLDLAQALHQVIVRGDRLPDSGSGLSARDRSGAARRSGNPGSDAGRTASNSAACAPASPGGLTTRCVVDGYTWLVRRCSMSPMLTTMVSASAVNGTHSPCSRQHFQPGRAGADQQGDEVDVLVRAGAHVRDVVGGDRRVVDRAQDRVAEVGLVGEEVLGQVDVQGQRRQHPRAQAIERLVQPVADVRWNSGTSSGHRFGGITSAYFESRGISRPMCQNSLRSKCLESLAVSMPNGV